ncbi:MAG: enoyl-CoA hydratase/isomerase family protein, partial [Acidimicrobiales bacterium]
MITESLDGGVLTLTLDRPDKHNALTLAMRRRLEDLPHLVGADPGIKVVVLTGAGSSFCAGADLDEINAADGPIPATNPARGLAEAPCPVIAAVNGTCITGGLELALACDLILAGASARFADTHTKMGVLPRWGMSARLPRRVGSPRAIEMSLTGRFVDSTEALATGLVDRVVPDDDLSTVVATTAQTIATHDPA